MLAITPQMKILVAIEPVDFRRGIDGLVRLCKDALGEPVRRDGVLFSQSPKDGHQGADV